MLFLIELLPQPLLQPQFTPPLQSCHSGLIQNLLSQSSDALSDKAVSIESSASRLSAPWEYPKWIPAARKSSGKSEKVESKLSQAAEGARSSDWFPVFSREQKFSQSKLRTSQGQVESQGITCTHKFCFPSLLIIRMRMKVQKKNAKHVIEMLTL